MISSTRRIDTVAEPAQAKVRQSYATYTYNQENEYASTNAWLLQHEHAHFELILLYFLPVYCQTSLMP